MDYVILMPSAGKNLQPAPSAAQKKKANGRHKVRERRLVAETQKSFWCLECVKRYLIGDLESMQIEKLSLLALRVRYFK